MLPAGGRCPRAAQNIYCVISRERDLRIISIDGRVICGMLLGQLFASELSAVREGELKCVCLTTRRVCWLRKKDKLWDMKARILGNLPDIPCLSFLT